MNHLLNWLLEKLGLTLKNSNWIGVGASHVGERHIKMIPPRPCQDAFNFDNQRRMFAIICDGAGSSEHSQIASQGIAQHLGTWIKKNEFLFKKVLDNDSPSDSESLSNLVIAECSNKLAELKSWYQFPESALNTTLSMIVWGKVHCFWLTVGDSSLCIRVQGNWKRIGIPPAQEFTNITHVLRIDKARTAFQSGFVRSETCNAIALMSDGTAERLINRATQTIAPALEEMRMDLLQGKFTDNALDEFLTSPNIWKATSQDDRTLILLAQRTGK